MNQSVKFNTSPGAVVTRRSKPLAYGGLLAAACGVFQRRQ